MTNPLSASGNTSLPLSGRAPEDPKVLKNAPPPLSPPPTAVTSVWSAPPAIARATTPASAWDGPTVYEDESAQLSERDSIFATHYITSDSTADTPPLLDAKGRHDDAQNAQQDAVAKMDLPAPHFPDPPESAPVFQKNKSSPTITSLSGFENGLDSRRGRQKRLASTESGSLDFLEYYQARAGSLDRVGRRKRVHDLLPFISPVDTPVDRPSTPRENPGMLPMPSDGAQNTVVHSRHDERSGRGEQIRSAGEGRSSSRHGSGSVEKTIEASLSKTEPAQNPRSRKTSHYLGLFKENNPSQENRRRDETAKEKTSKENVKDPGTHARLAGEFQQTSPHTESSSSAQGDATLTSEALRGTRPGSTEKRLPPVDGDDIQKGTLLPFSAESIEPSSSVETTNSLSHGNNEPVRSKEREKGNTASVSTRVMTHTIPLRLLEEIRNHHNLTPGAERGTSFSRSIPTVSAEQSTHHSGGPDSYPISVENSQEQDGATADRDSAENEDEEESEKEQISSALYFPHQTPVLDAVERVRSSRETEAGDPCEYSAVSEPESTVLQRRKTELGESPSNKVEIDLHSPDEHRHLHSDLQQPQNPLRDSELQLSTKTSDIGSSSASNSDYESPDETAFSSREDDTNLTDDADITPTATPVARAAHASLKSRSPRQHPSAPLGAVELKPYSHQVGGHTTVFRFSRRAVCKQLSNRENEFYETVERRHPELLRFLPRYAWFSEPIP